MKKKIHPKYYRDTKVTCACGASFITGSTLKSISIDICSQCHPFFTGEMRFVDTMGRVEKFTKKRAAAIKLNKSKKAKKIKTKKVRPTTLKEMMMQQPLKKNK